MSAMEQEIGDMTSAILQLSAGVNVASVLGANLNVIMTVLQSFPHKELRLGTAIHLRNIAEQLEAMDGVKS